MQIHDFISQYKNHPVLFVGAGLSLRYLNNSYTWDGLLRFVCRQLKGSDEFYLDKKSECGVGDKYQFDKLGGIIEEEFTKILVADRNGEFKAINDRFYELMDSGRNVTRLKIYMASILSELDIKKTMEGEVSDLKKARKNVGSIITTNYDRFVESVFDFHPLVGNDILLSNPYGSVYKVHGCVNDPVKIILTNRDYDNFNARYELIRAQLLSIFIHNPIIFLGYSITDDNIKSILKTIFTYVEPNSDVAKRIRSNFLLVEYDQGSNNLDVGEHDIDVEGNSSTIRINKIKTDDFSSIYKSIASLNLPVSAMDVRKVQNIVKDIYSGGSIKVNITEDLDDLDNSEKILVIGSVKTIKYEYQTSSEVIKNYFDILDEENSRLVALIDKFSIPKSNFFPICGFYLVNGDLSTFSLLKDRQREHLISALGKIPTSAKVSHKTTGEVMADSKVSTTNKELCILLNFVKGDVSIDEMESFLRKYQNKKNTGFRKMLCVYDFVKYSGESISYNQSSRKWESK